MAAASVAHDPGIDIRRLALVLRLCGDPQRQQPVAQRLEQVAKGRLGQALARTRLDGPPSATAAESGELVFIERLAVHCVGNTAWDDDALASHLAHRLALALTARLADPDVLRFRDRPDYVAAAALAIAQTRLAQCWWFEAFDGLQSLPASAALRTLIINEGAQGTAALARLAEASLAQVIGTLSEGDASRLLAWTAGFGASAAPPFPPLWAGALRLHSQGAAAGPWLAALVAGERAAPGSMGARSLRLLRGMAAQLRRAARGELHLPQDTRDRAMVEAMLAGDGDESAWLHGLSQGEWDTVLATLQEMQPAPAQTARGQRLATPHGGFFLLLARMHSLDWTARLESALRHCRPEWPEARRDALCRTLLCRIAAAALGPLPHGWPLADAAIVAVCRPENAEVDGHTGLAVAALRSVLRDAAPIRRGLWPAPAHARTSERWPRLLAEAAAVVLANFANALPGLAGSTAAFLRAQALSLPAVAEAPAPGHDGGEMPSLVRLGRAPLDVLLVLSGVKRQRLPLPGVPPIELREDYSV